MFAATLTAVVCAIPQNGRGDDAIGQWLTKQPLDFRHARGFWRTPPTASGLWKLLSKIDVTALEDALTRWITVVLPEEIPSADLIPIAVADTAGKGLPAALKIVDFASELLNQSRRSSRPCPGSISSCANSMRASSRSVSPCLIRANIA